MSNKWFKSYHNINSIKEAGDIKIKYTDTLLLNYLYSLHESCNIKVISPSVARICMACGFTTRKQASRAVKVLERAKFITCEHRYGRTTIYTVMPDLFTRTDLVRVDYNSVADSRIRMDEYSEQLALALAETEQIRKLLEEKTRESEAKDDHYFKTEVIHGQSFEDDITAILENNITIN